MRNIIGLILLVGVGCKQISNYEKLKQEQLKLGVSVDSIFLGINFNMDSKSFYTHCWELNKQNLIMQGPGNLSVEYKIDSTLKFPTYMRFYPEFEDGKILKMPVEFVYDRWSPWNRSTSADSLMIDLIPMLEQWYQTPFIEEYSNKRNKSVWYNITGDRQIFLYKKDTSTVRMEISKLN